MHPSELLCTLPCVLGVLASIAAAQNQWSAPVPLNLAAAAGRIDGSFVSPTTLTSGNALRSADIDGADLDGDGDLDLLAMDAADSHVAVFENLGSGGFGARNIVATFPSGVSSSLAVIRCVSLDGGLPDLVYAAATAGEIGFLENIEIRSPAGSQVGALAPSTGSLPTATLPRSIRTSEPLRPR